MKTVLCLISLAVILAVAQAKSLGSPENEEEKAWSVNAGYNQGPWNIGAGWTSNKDGSRIIYIPDHTVFNPSPYVLYKRETPEETEDKEWNVNAGYNNGNGLNVGAGYGSSNGWNANAGYNHNGWNVGGSWSSGRSMMESPLVHNPIYTTFPVHQNPVYYKRELDVESNDKKIDWNVNAGVNHNGLSAGVGYGNDGWGAGVGYSHNGVSLNGGYGANNWNSNPAFTQGSAVGVGLTARWK